MKRWAAILLVSGTFGCKHGGGLHWGGGESHFGGGGGGSGGFHVSGNGAHGGEAVSHSGASVASHLAGPAATGHGHLRVNANGDPGGVAVDAEDDGLDDAPDPADEQPPAWDALVYLSNNACPVGRWMRLEDAVLRRNTTLTLNLQAGRGWLSSALASAVGPVALEPQNLEEGALTVVPSGPLGGVATVRVDFGPNGRALSVNVATEDANAPCPP